MALSNVGDLALAISDTKNLLNKAGSKVDPTLTASIQDMIDIILSELKSLELQNAQLSEIDLRNIKFKATESTKEINRIISYHKQEIQRDPNDMTLVYLYQRVDEVHSFFTRNIVNETPSIIVNKGPIIGVDFAAGKALDPREEKRRQLEALKQQADLKKNSVPRQPEPTDDYDSNPNQLASTDDYDSNPNPSVSTDDHASNTAQVKPHVKSANTVATQNKPTSSIEQQIIECNYGTFKVIKKLGSGSFGEVSLVHFTPKSENLSESEQQTIQLLTAMQDHKGQLVIKSTGSTQIREQSELAERSGNMVNTLKLRTKIRDFITEITKSDKTVAQMELIGNNIIIKGNAQSDALSCIELLKERLRIMGLEPSQYSITQKNKYGDLYQLDLNTLMDQEALTQLSVMSRQPTSETIKSDEARFVSGGIEIADEEGKIFYVSEFAKYQSEKDSDRSSDMESFLEKFRSGKLENSSTRQFMEEVPEIALLQILSQIAQQQIALHKKNILHLDTHTRNIMMMQPTMVQDQVESINASLVDFGLSEYITAGNMNNFERSIIAGISTPMYTTDPKDKLDGKMTVRTELFSLRATLLIAIAQIYQSQYREFLKPYVLMRKDQLPSIAFSEELKQEIPPTSGTVLGISIALGKILQSTHPALATYFENIYSYIETLACMDSKSTIDPSFAKHILDDLKEFLTKMPKDEFLLSSDASSYTIKDEEDTFNHFMSQSVEKMYEKLLANLDINVPSSVDTFVLGLKRLSHVSMNQALSNSIKTQIKFFETHAIDFHVLKEQLLIEIVGTNNINPTEALQVYEKHLTLLAKTFDAVKEIELDIQHIHDIQQSSNLNSHKCQIDLLLKTIYNPELIKKINLLLEVNIPSFTFDFLADIKGKDEHEQNVIDKITHLVTTEISKQPESSLRTLHYDIERFATMIEQPATEKQDLTVEVNIPKEIWAQLNPKQDTLFEQKHEAHQLFTKLNQIPHKIEPESEFIKLTFDFKELKDTLDLEASSQMKNK